ncbi:hypothetical protein FACS1894152_8260 [Bacilli bacterium]|nr:hypothetical protein FACS1894152_8260 [Bacilli bacterium]
MRIDLKDIIETQRILDKSIHSNHHVSYDVVYPELKLALFVELAELANEVRSFKSIRMFKPSLMDQLIH